MTPDDVRIALVAVNAPTALAYAYAANAENLPHWAPGFARSVSRSAEDHVVETDAGPHTVRFAARNDFGVLDHWVYTPDGTEFYNPMRVVAHGAGCIVPSRCSASRAGPTRISPGTSASSRPTWSG